MGKVFKIESRRRFFRKAVSFLGLAALLPAVASCEKKTIPGRIIGADSKLGHRLRTGDFPPVSREEKTTVVIIGGGIAGLSAARKLNKAGIPFQLLELHSEAGGNAIGGSSEVSAYPWGAHYLPLPLHTDLKYLAFLQEAGVITGTTDGLPVYNEYYVCFDPKERLLINNFWQDGLTPSFGVPANDLEQIRSFLERMEYYKHLKGSDGRDAFTIPVSNSSADQALRDLDRISVREYLKRNNFTSEYLHWYINYCCLDDFGSSLDETSAWAAIHYFASRKGKAANIPHDSVLTWQEGNHFLVKKLVPMAGNNIRTRSLVFNVSQTDEGAAVTYFDASAEKSIRVSCSAVIMATPQFITQRLIGSHKPAQFQYSPWVVANVTVNHRLSERRGEELAWDNVIYGTSHLGYIHANHQQTSQSSSGRRVITYYRALSGNDTEQRKAVFEKTYEEWQALVLGDLRKAHPEIDNVAEDINVYVWGHGMVKPYPGFIWNEERIRAGASINNKIFFAHSDLSGISIFEEAFHNGMTAAESVIKIFNSYADHS